MIEYRIHPTIGVCRVGNSPTEFFIGPERPGQRPSPPGGFKDSECRIKRQAARFRIFAHDTDAPASEPIDVTDSFVQIRWTVQIGRNSGRTVFDRTASVAGRLARQEFSPFTPVGTTVSVPLGELRTDKAGRLIMLSGFGATSEAPHNTNAGDAYCDEPRGH